MAYFAYCAAAGSVLALLLAPGYVVGQPPDEIGVGTFSSAAAGGAIPEGWQPLTFEKIDRHTVYTLVEDGGAVVVKAVSEASASGLIRKLTVDPTAYPWLEWRWKVGNVLEKGDVRRKTGDDYPARLYVTFRYDPQRVGFFERAKYGTAKLLYGDYPPHAALNYIWANREEIGAVVPNAYTSKAVMIVAESGASKAGQWVAERRNVYRDYLRAFGEEPPLISGVAVMTDTDNTGERATAYYGDIRFRKDDRRE